MTPAGGPRDVFRGAERLMGMDERAWMRHANPWSVWTRFTCLPLIALAIWSRAWIGWWALAPLALALAWTWWNPRAFPPPRSLDSWASRGVLGERVYLHHREEVAAHHRRAATVLTAASLPGAAVLVWGLAALDPWPAILGVPLTVLPKLWFADRMVWVWEDRLRAGRDLGALSHEARRRPEPAP